MTMLDGFIIEAPFVNLKLKIHVHVDFYLLIINKTYHATSFQVRTPETYCFTDSLIASLSKDLSEMSMS